MNRLLLRCGDYSEADEGSFRRALETQVAAIEGACEDLTEYIHETCPIDDVTGRLRDPLTDALVNANQPIIDPGPDPTRPNVLWRPKIVALAQHKSNVRMYPAKGVGDAPRDKKGNVPAGTCLHDYVPISSGAEHASRPAFLIAPQAGLMVGFFCGPKRRNYTGRGGGGVV